MTFDPNDYEIIVDAYVCSYHKKNPGIDFPGCSCCSGFGMKPKNISKFLKEVEPNLDILDELFE